MPRMSSTILSALALAVACRAPASQSPRGAPGGGAASAPAGGYAASFAVAGSVEHPATFTLEQLRALPATRLEVSYETGRGTEHGVFTGVLLWDLLGAAGVVAPQGRGNDLLREYLVVTGSDGYQAVVAFGEILPKFGAQQILVAYERDGQPLGEKEGMARLVVPGDKAAGRHVRNIARIEVRDAGP